MTNLKSTERRIKWYIDIEIVLVHLVTVSEYVGMYYQHCMMYKRKYKYYVYVKSNLTSFTYQ